LAVVNRLVVVIKHLTLKLPPYIIATGICQ